MHCLCCPYWPIFYCWPSYETLIYHSRQFRTNWSEIFGPFRMCTCNANDHFLVGVILQVWTSQPPKIMTYFAQTLHNKSASDLIGEPLHGLDIQTRGLNQFQFQIWCLCLQQMFQEPSFVDGGDHIFFGCLILISLLFKGLVPLDDIDHSTETPFTNTFEMFATLHFCLRQQTCL